MDNSFTKMDMHQKPVKTKWYLAFLLWVLVKPILFFGGIKFKVKRENFKRVKGGCLVISNHMSFEDMKLLEVVIRPRRSFYVSSIDEYCGKEKLMQNLGCIPKKVHFKDMAFVRTIVRLLKEGEMVTIYPEATYSFAGVPNYIDQDLGKLAKLGNSQVMVISLKGDYLYSPRWNTLPKNKEVKLLANAKIVVNAEEVKNLTADEIQARINEAFKYDEYQYQRDNNIHIKNKTMAHNIERILFKCPNCLNERCIHGENNTITCSCCNASYDIDELSILKNKNGETKFDKISDWYLWQRQFVKKDIYDGTYKLSFPVKVSRFLNPELGFDHYFAKGTATQTDKGIVVEGYTKDNEPFKYVYDEKNNQTIHLTFDVKGCQESAFEVHDSNESYLVYPLDGTSIIKIRFAVEEAHNKFMDETKNKR